MAGRIELFIWGVILVFLWVWVGQDPDLSKTITVHIASWIAIGMFLFGIRFIIWIVVEAIKNPRTSIECYRCPHCKTRYSVQMFSGGVCPNCTRDIID